jgi:hypothetical protein
MHMPCCRTSSSCCHRDLTGLRFGRWVVQSFAAKKGSHRLWLCCCDCGTQKPVFEGALLHGHSTQCLPCSWRHRTKSNKNMKSYVAWNRLRKLCALPQEWRDYEAFREALGEPPAENARLRKRDAALPHAPGNTYWGIPDGLPCSQRTSRKYRTLDIVWEDGLQRIRSAKTRHEKTRCIAAARSEGYTYEIIGIAAGLSRQAVFQVVRRHANRGR